MGTSMGEIQQWSLKLYGTLEFVGASEDMRLIKRRLTNQAEMLDTIEYYNVKSTRAYPRREYFVGSYYEAAVTPDLNSDIDTIYVEENVLVVTNATLRVSDRLKVLLIRDDDTYPGYVKLQPVVSGKPLTVHTNQSLLDYWIFLNVWLNICLELNNDRHGNICCNSSSDYNRPGFNYFKMYRNGPAWGVYENCGRHEFDNVFSFECERIPEFGKGWLRRQRKYGWPGQPLLDELSQICCLVVRKGHEDSAESRLEWRISFTLQERRLMTSLNPVQHKVYVLLKMIKREIVQQHKDLEDAIGSYELKTCLMYVIENTPARYWEKANLLGCLLYTLNVFTRWLRNGHCPNFFISEQNLFLKGGLKLKRKRLATVFEVLLKEKHMLIFRLRCDRIGKLLLPAKERVLEQFLIWFAPWYNFQSYKEQLMWFTGGKVVESSRSVIYEFQPNHPSHIEQVTKCVMQNMHLREYTNEERYEIVEYILPWVHLHVAIGVACNPHPFKHAEKIMPTTSTKHTIRML